MAARPPCSRGAALATAADAQPASRAPTAARHRRREADLRVVRAADGGGVHQVLGNWLRCGSGDHRRPPPQPAALLQRRFLARRVASSCPAGAPWMRPRCPPPSQARGFQDLVRSCGEAFLALLVMDALVVGAARWLEMNCAPGFRFWFMGLSGFGLCGCDGPRWVRALPARSQTHRRSPPTRRPPAPTQWTSCRCNSLCSESAPTSGTHAPCQRDALRPSLLPALAPAIASSSDSTRCPRSACCSALSRRHRMMNHIVFFASNRKSSV